MSSWLELGNLLPEVAVESEIPVECFAVHSATGMARSQYSVESDSGTGVGPIGTSPEIVAAAGIPDTQSRQGLCTFRKFDHPQSCDSIVAG